MFNLMIYTLLLIIAAVMNKGICTPLVNDNDDAKAVTKRSLKNFGSMVECETNNNKWMYNGYGCYCGFGGTGEPLDGVDRCCYEHDKCYGEVMAGSECTTSVDPYIVSYKISNCSDCAPAEEYNYWDWIGWVTISCRRAICRCDSVAAKCFATNVYNNIFASYDKSKCGHDKDVLS